MSESTDTPSKSKLPRSVNIFFWTMWVVFKWLTPAAAIAATVASSRYITILVGQAKTTEGKLTIMGVSASVTDPTTADSLIAAAPAAVATIVILALVFVDPVHKILFLALTETPKSRGTTSGRAVARVGTFIAVGVFGWTVTVAMANSHFKSVLGEGDHTFINPLSIVLILVIAAIAIVKMVLIISTEMLSLRQAYDKATAELDTVI